MWSPFFDQLSAMIEADPALHRADAPLGALNGLLRLTVPFQPTRALPWGRYLMHQTPHFNAQLDVFSSGYVGGMHRHGTWGVFFVLAGALLVEDNDAVLRPLRLARVPSGGAMAFTPPDDWHRVATPATGAQTVSLHLYGPGFDLDEGEALGADGRPMRYRRGAWGNLEALEGAFL